MAEDHRYAVDYGYPWGYLISDGCAMLLEYCTSDGTCIPKQFTYAEACAAQMKLYREGRRHCRVVPYPKLQTVKEKEASECTRS